jgi:hypothetical protein
MGIIYQIVCNQTGERYIGSTSMGLTKRMSNHRTNNDGCCSKQIIDRGYYTADILEETELEGIELLKREQYYMDTMDCINQKRSYGRLTRRQYYHKNREKQLKQEKEYRQNNKDKIKETKKQYYLKNRDKINEKSRQYNLKNKEKRKEYHTKYRHTNKDKIKEKGRKYHLKNQEKRNQYTRQYYQYQSSWGGDKRSNNNLLCIDVNLFTV